MSPPTPASPFLCLDFGLKHLGLAIADASLAKPLQTIPTNQALSQIQSLVHQYQIKSIVIGLSEGKMAQLTRLFGRQLSQLTHLPIYYHDETLTSYDVRVKAAQAGIKKSRRQGKLDHFAAAAILQDFLDTHHQTRP